MLNFKPITLSSLSTINKYFQLQNYRTCDFTIGGLFMWVPYFKYEYEIHLDTLFIKGVSEINLTETVFSIPVGELPIENSIQILVDYCENKSIKFVLSAVPEEVVYILENKYSFNHIKLENWSDYLYDIESLATLKGKRYNKKRNHINKFLQLYPDFLYSKITKDNISDVFSFFQQYNSINNKDNPVFRNEAEMTKFVLENYKDFNFTGSFIKIKDEIAGFIVGEMLHDTLYIHISKANKKYDGIYEFLNNKFMEELLEFFPVLKFVNTEEDVGDEGLRKSKLSYYPIKLLNKFNLEFL